jgi:hypothetical protein
MNANTNVQIPFTLFTKINTLVDHLYFSKVDLPLFIKLDDIRNEISKKQLSINKHILYSNIVHAKDDAQRKIARYNYLKVKNLQ